MLETINSFVEPYVEQLFTLLGGFPYYLQAAVLLGLALFAVIGLFVFLKKFIKLFIFLAILGGIFYYVSTQTTLLDGLLGYVQVFSIKMLNF